MTTAEIISAKVLAALSVRGGFDGFWDSIDPETKIEIAQTLAQKVQSVLDGNLQLSAFEDCFTIEELKSEQ